MPGRLQLVSTETLAIHVSLPFMLVVSLAYAAEALRRLTAERSARERLAIEAERKRIAFRNCTTRPSSGCTPRTCS